MEDRTLFFPHLFLSWPMLSKHNLHVSDMWQFLVLAVLWCSQGPETQECSPASMDHSSEVSSRVLECRGQQALPRPSL